MPDRHTQRAQSENSKTHLEPLDLAVSLQYLNVEPFVDKETFCKQHQISKSQLDEHERKGWIKYTRIGRRCFVAAPDAIAYFERLRQHTAETPAEIIEQRKTRTSAATKAAALSCATKRKSRNETK